MLTWSPMDNKGGYENLSGYQGHCENLIYVLIRNGNDRLIKVIRYLMKEKLSY